MQTWTVLRGLKIRYFQMTPAAALAVQCLHCKGHIKLCSPVRADDRQLLGNVEHAVSM